EIHVADAVDIEPPVKNDSGDAAFYLFFDDSHAHIPPELSSRTPGPGFDAISDGQPRRAIVWQIQITEALYRREFNRFERSRPIESPGSGRLRESNRHPASRPR